MREDLEKLVFDTLHEIAMPEFDGFHLRQRVDDILIEHDKIVTQEREEARDEGYESYYDNNYWEIEDARSDGYDEGYQEGYDAAREEFEQSDEND